MSYEYMALANFMDGNNEAFKVAVRGIVGALREAPAEPAAKDEFVRKITDNLFRFLRRAADDSGMVFSNEMVKDIAAALMLSARDQIEALSKDAIIN
jgi:hypothetical protein